MVATEVADGVAREEVEVSVALGIPQVGAFGPHVLPVEADRAQDGGEPRVHVLGELAGALPAFAGEEGRQVEVHCEEPSSHSWLLEMA